MFTRTLVTLALVSTLSWSVTSSASTTSIGSLSWDNSTDFIVNSVNGMQYVQLGLFKGLSYAEVTTAISTTAAYSHFHIATRNDILAFYNAATGKNLTTERDTSSTLSPGFVDGVLGFNDVDYAEYIFGIDSATESKGSMLIINNDDDSVTLSTGVSKGLVDSYAEGGDSWLVVTGQISAVPIPAAGFMFAPALLGFAAFRRKNRA